MIKSLFQSYQDVLLIESLDTPYKLTDVTHLQDQSNIDYIKSAGFSDIKMYQCDDEPGHAFMTGFRSNAFEIHHQNYQNGEDMAKEKNLLDKVPVKFVATAVSLAKGQLDKGHSVRIVAPDHFVDSYHRLASAVGRKYNYNVSMPIRHDHDTHSFMIGRDSSPLFGYPQISKLNKP